MKSSALNVNKDALVRYFLQPYCGLKKCSFLFGISIDKVRNILAEAGVCKLFICYEPKKVLKKKSAPRFVQHPRMSAIYRKWRDSVFIRDRYTCQKCGSIDRIEAHHVESWIDNVNKRFDPDNGITLCRDCHRPECQDAKVAA